MSTTRHLARQFSTILSGAQDTGLEMGSAPGMVRIGGLHVPAAAATLHSSSDYERDAVIAHVGDNMGNMFTIKSSPFAGGRRDRFRASYRDLEGNFQQIESADHFADIYNDAVGWPKDQIRNDNLRELDRNSGIARRMGAEPGQMVTFHNTGRERDNHIFDPRTGIVRNVLMDHARAHEQWQSDWKRRQAGEV